MTEDIKEIKFELFENQNRIINIQSEAINELLHALSVCMNAEELDNLPAIEKINHAAALRAEHKL